MATPLPGPADPLEVLTSVAVCHIRRDYRQVWNFIRPAESSLLLTDGAVRAFVVPGTGPGAGEQQCTVVNVSGRLRFDVIEVLEEAPPVAATYRLVTGDVDMLTRLDLTPDGDECVYRTTVRYTAAPTWPAGTLAAAANEIKDEHIRSALRVGRVVEANTSLG
jgi:hypothetical protein